MSTATGTYSTGATPGTGVATVTATGGASDGGSDNVTIIPVTPAAPVLTLAGPGRDSVAARELCLTVKGGASAAYECGDLRLTHALPPTRTVNVTRTPVLVYSSQQAHPYPLVGVNVGLPSSATQPDSVIATLTIGGVQRARQKWLGSQWTPGRASRIAVGYDALADTSGRYPYALQVTNYYGTSPFSTSVNDALLMVNRSASPFGPGWWLAGLEQLRIASTIEWVGGNGDIKVYRSAGTNLWVAPATTRPDTLKLVSGTFYARLLAGGDTVKFDLAGNHIATVRPLNWQTTFNYTSGLLNSITIPPSGAGLSYTFSYTSGALTSVTAPGARTTTIGRTNGVVTSIRDPGDSAVGFGYAVPASKLITSRTNRVGVSDAYTYDAAQRLQSVQVGNFTGHTGAVVTAFTSLESLGFAAAMDTASAETIMDGPRQDSVDITHFRLDRYGNPWRIVDAHGGTTTVARADTRFPALATRLQDPTGVVTLASYDGWGNVATVTDSLLQVGGQPSVTRYEWDSKWQAVTKVAPPEGDSVLIAYDPTTGNRVSQQDARGTTSQVQYRYYTAGSATGLLRAVRSPLGAVDSLIYDNLNNVVQTQGPLGRWSLFYKDGIGRDTLARTPIDTTFTTYLPTDSVITNYHWQRTRYDAIGRVSETAAWAAPLAPNDPLHVGSDTLHVQSTYDAESRPTLVDHWATPDRAAVSQILTQWGYDYEGRRVFEQAGDGMRDSTQYDGAGNPVRQFTRRGHVIILTYDALNRLLRRVTPAATYTGFTLPFFKDSTGLALSFPNYPNDGGTGFVLAADTAQFTYDVAGRMLTANNGDARVTRTYGADGRLSTETQAVRTVSGSDFSQHVYTTQFGYDRDGRRAWLKLPAALAAGAGKDTIRYSYANTGQLGSVRDPLGNSFQYLYDLENKVDSLVLPGGLFEKRFYDAEGRLIRRRAGTATVTWHDEAQVVNAAGNALRAVTLVDSMTYKYSPMGPLLHQWTQSRSDATYHMDEYWESDVTPYRTSSSVGGVLGVDTLGDSRFMIYQSGTGRLQSHLKIIPPGGMHWTVEGFTYDASGNQLRDSTRLYQVPSDFTSNLGVHELVSYYDAAQQLRAVDRRGCITWGDAFPTHPTGKCMPQFTLDSSLVPSWQGLPSVPAYIHRYTAPNQVSEAAFEEYRYDALGRRVWRRSRAKPLQCLDTSCHDILVRYAWDGSVILGEFQAPGGDTSSGVWERDAGLIGSLTGHVVYIHGLEMDRPLAVVRMDESTEHPAYMLQLHRDIRGTVDSWTPDASVCSTPCFNTSGVPGLVGGLKATKRHTNFGPPSPWYGSLVYEGQDASGYLYRRNRYIDYASGRFTQEDPLGLAGGLNAYGFADGDPIAVSDPFGLKGCRSDDYLCQLARSGFQALSGALGLLGGWAGGTVACGPGAPLCAVTVAPAVALAAGATSATVAGAAFDNLLQFSDASDGSNPTIHGAKRLADPTRLSPDQVADVVSNPTQKYVQGDGANVFVQQVGDRFNVVIQSEDGRLITDLKTIDQKALDNLARNYGWSPAF